MLKFFGRDTCEFLKFADEVGKVINYCEEFRHPFPTRTIDLFRFLYDSESKQRIYALLIVFVSMLTALAIREGAGISNVFELINENSEILFATWLMLVLISGMVLVFLLHLRVGLVLLLTQLGLFLDGKKARNPLTLQYLQQDLLRFHRFIQL